MLIEKAFCLWCLLIIDYAVRRKTQKLVILIFTISVTTVGKS